MREEMANAQRRGAGRQVNRTARRWRPSSATTASRTLGGTSVEGCSQRLGLGTAVDGGPVEGYGLPTARAPGPGSEERESLSQLLSASRQMRAGELREQDRAGVWLWSDLHLGHAMALSFLGRPYWTLDEMDDALFGAWRQGVDPGDTVVILGDVAIGGLSGRRLKRFQAAPGRKVLVVGNHEFDSTVGGHLDGFDEVFSTVYVPGSPGLLLTHVAASRCSRGLRECAWTPTHAGLPPALDTSTWSLSRCGTGRGLSRPFAVSRRVWPEANGYRGGRRPSS